MPDNPCRKLRKLKVQEDAQPDFLTEDEIDVLLDLCSTKPKSEFVQERDHLIFLLMLHCGLRRIEVSNLRWSDVDFKRQLLIVRNGKGGKDRFVALNETMHDALKNCTRLSDEFVVTTRTGGQLSRTMMTRITAKYLDAILLEAGRSAESDESPPTLLADNGVENKTKAIDGLVNSGALRRVLAQTEIACSNSMIEAWWRTLKHQWLSF